MPLLKHEFNIQKRYLFFWTLISSVIVFAMFSEFFNHHKSPEMIRVLNQMPKHVLEIFGINQAKLASPSGFLSLASLNIFLIGGAFAIILGNNAIAREERDRTAEFYLALPISRERILVTKWLASCIQCLIFSAFTFLSILTAALPYGFEANYITYLLLITFSLYMIQMIFLSIGMLLAAFFKRSSKSKALTLAFISASYCTTLLKDASDVLSQFKYISPFNFFDPHEMLNQMTLDSYGIGLTLSLTLLLLATTFYLYPKRDLPL